MNTELKSISATNKLINIYEAFLRIPLFFDLILLPLEIEPLVFCVFVRQLLCCCKSRIPWLSLTENVRFSMKIELASSLVWLIIFPHLCVQCSDLYSRLDYVTSIYCLFIESCPLYRKRFYQFCWFDGCGNEAFQSYGMFTMNVVHRWTENHVRLITVDIYHFSFDCSIRRSQIYSYILWKVYSKMNQSHLKGYVPIIHTYNDFRQYSFGMKRVLVTSYDRLQVTQKFEYFIF